MQSHDAHIALMGFGQEALLTVSDTTYEYASLNKETHLFGRLGESLHEYADIEMKVYQVHALFNSLGVKMATLDFEDFSGDDGPYEYIWLNPTEFQLFAVGDMPTNYVIEE